MVRIFKKVRLVLAIALVAAFSYSALFSIFFEMNMPSHNGAGMNGCVFFATHKTICPMGARDHIQKWQEAFTGIPQKQAVPFALAAAAIALTITLFTAMRLRLFCEQTRMLVKIKRKTLLSRLFPHLKHAFSKGILHPKLCEIG